LKLELQKCLTTLDLTSLGVGSCVGTGMYLVAGMVARNYAGPGVVVSFIIAAVASIFSGKYYAAPLCLSPLYSVLTATNQQSVRGSASYITKNLAFHLPFEAEARLNVI
jgi:L-asparagine transporter-like permease